MQSAAAVAQQAVNPLLKECLKESLYEQSDNQKDSGGCFHGFGVKSAPPTISNYKLGDKLGSGVSGVVYEAECLSCRQCKLAIKKEIMRYQRDIKLADEERDALEYAQSLNSQHIIHYYGFFDQGIERYFVFEKMDMNLRVLLDKSFKVDFDVSYFNEIFFQLLEIIEFLDNIGFYPDDIHGICASNLVINLSTGKIKLIDLEYPCYRGEPKYQSPLRYVSGIGLMLLDFQTEIKFQYPYMHNNSTSYRTRRNRIKQIKMHSRLKNEGLKKTKVELFVNNDELWLPSIKKDTRELLAHCFVDDYKRTVFERKSLLSPRRNLSSILSQQLDQLPGL